MRYIIYVIIGILMFLFAFSPLIALYSLHHELQQYIASINASIDKINQSVGEIDQKNEIIRQEVERIKSEPSRGGNRRTMEISYYTPAADENGGYDGTSSGAPLTVGRTIAAGPGIPFGTRIFIPGVDWRVVEDRGSAITDGRIDVLVDDKETAYANGRHMAQVVIER